MQQNELKKNHANYSPLTPIVFIEKAAKIFPDRYSIIHENKWLEGYLDFGLIKNKSEKSRFLYDSGLRINILPGNKLL